jgi:hypothetical protein
MSDSNVPTLQECNAILGGLKQKILKLLDEHAEMDAPYTPNYVGFSEDLGQLIEPIICYVDAAFHQGASDPGPFLSFVNIVAELKLETQRNWTRASQKLGSNHRRSIRYYGHFKLLMWWFGYGGESPWSKLQIYDLLYQIEQSEDSREKESLIAQLKEIAEGTSTASYLAAFEAFEDGDFSRALAECEDSIKRFPENTPAYQLKSRILSAMATEALQSGLAREPKDAGLKDALALDLSIKQLRTRFRAGSLSFDAFASEIEKFCSRIAGEHADDLATYAIGIESTLPGLSAFPSDVTTFLCTGEYLLDRLPTQYDHAAAAIEFCKAVEVAVFHRVFYPFREGISAENLSQFPMTDDNKKLLKFCTGRFKLTLGDMTYLIQISNSRRKKAEDPLIAALDVHLCRLGSGNFGAILRDTLKDEHIQKYRNSAAHDGVYSLQTAKEASMWAYGCLHILTESPIQR